MLQLKDLPDSKILSKFAKRYPDADIERVIQFLTLLRVGSDLSSVLDNFLDSYGLLQGRWWVLILLMREQDLMSTPSSLAEKAGVSRATMTGLIDGLVKEALVIRVTGVDDRRKFHIKLTASGQSKLDEVMPEYYRRVGDLMSVLSNEQGGLLTSMLTKLQNNSGVFK
ncbi:MAG: MarR family transcriptional regulator [Gammaproteobacteria bacterium]|nr:MAG: MarR family transcriptional regulator [Gammaproteobacteria bacterium]